MLLSACLVFIFASEPVAALSHPPAWRPTRVPQPVLHAARSTPAKSDDEIPGLRLLVASQLLSAVAAVTYESNRKVLPAL